MKIFKSLPLVFLAALVGCRTDWDYVHEHKNTCVLKFHNDQGYTIENGKRVLDDYDKPHVTYKCDDVYAYIRDTELAERGQP